MVDMISGDGPILRLKDLAKGYESVRAIDGLTLELARGSIVALLGPNGAGKTTTFKCILGITGFEGSVEVAGLPAKRHGRTVRRLIGYLPQAPVFGEGETCRGVLEFLADLKGASRGRVEAMLKRVDLWDHRERRVGHLSGGMRQRLALAAALLADPPLLLLDEPTANLDAESRARFQDLVRELRGEGKTIVLSTHLVDGLVEIADRIIVLREGKVAFDRPAAELAAAGRLRYVVDLNGTSIASFMDALGGLGIGPERVRPAASPWEEIMSAPSVAAPEAGKLQKP